ncbi:hypothetical protein TSOC_007623 [Tetrabaena socialis]|uniref:Protein kinase domain-containing protein n=1 Tax=Tetrabaena socialis TaxID=47790 RepID=A0A2J8A0K6_9CHLO|nr:hypothetical protein TSOC_007623 [Tetrabaena socialis]|eukprot:PNH06057.1 hypothetical protein TSOC_007623 [Tetrabaena socialis]
MHVRAGTLKSAAECGSFRQPGVSPKNGPACPALLPLYTSLLELALALRHLHARRLAHCDLKPSNVLLKSSMRDPRGWTSKVQMYGYFTDCVVVQVTSRPWYTHKSNRLKLLPSDSEALQQYGSQRGPVNTVMVMEYCDGGTAGPCGGRAVVACRKAGSLNSRSSSLMRSSTLSARSDPAPERPPEGAVAAAAEEGPAAAGSAAAAELPLAARRVRPQGKTATARSYTDLHHQPLDHHGPLLPHAPGAADGLLLHGGVHAGLLRTSAFAVGSAARIALSSAMSVRSLLSQRADPGGAPSAAASSPSSSSSSSLSAAAPRLPLPLARALGLGSGGGGSARTPRRRLARVMGWRQEGQLWRFILIAAECKVHDA